MPVALSSDVRNEAKTLYLAGETPNAIEKKLGLGRCTVAQWVKRHGWDSLRQGVTDQVNKVLSSRVAGNLAKQGVKTRALMAQHGEALAERLANEPIRDFKELLGDKGSPGRVQVFKTLVEANTKVFGWDDQAAGLGGLPDLDAIDAEVVESPKTEPLQVVEGQADNK
jgi:hypothetical protein